VTGYSPRVEWLERHAWWGLMLISALLVAFGITDVIVGAAADPAIAVGLTGRTLDELRTESADAYRLFDFMTRANGGSLVLAGLGFSAILAFAFRHGRRWAWWVLWLMPLWGFAVALGYVVAGIQPERAPPPPLISGPIIAVVAAAILAATAPRFFSAD
jgi:hypothetical protein